MVTTKKPDGTDGTSEADSTGSGQRNKADQQLVYSAPIVIRLERSKKKSKSKRKYSRGSKASQRLVQGFADAFSRSANSLRLGTRTFAKRSKRSSKKRKDGLVRDSLRNASRGVGKGMEELGKAPYQVAKRIGTGQVRRAFKIMVPFGR